MTFHKTKFGASPQQLLFESQVCSKVPQSSRATTNTEDAPQPFHHYNFWGQKSLTENETDPAISFAILTSTVKSFMASDQFEEHARKYTIAWQAHAYLNPIIYAGNATDLKTPSISERRQNAVGQTHKFYLPHGSWRWTDLTDEDHLPVANGEIRENCPADCVIIDGHTCDKSQPTYASLTYEMDFAVRADKRRRDDINAERNVVGC